MKVLTSTLVTLTCIVSSVFCRTESVIRVEKKEGGCHKYRDVEGAAKAIDQLGILRDDPNISHYIKALYADEDRPDMFHKEIVVREVCTFTKPVTNSEEVTTIIKPFVLNYYTGKTN
ncbi:hypothetical protein AX774_g6804 [Zancudomyces culisetae]|uniref:Uncharacterized protein n=1 Tax=Zancudomyces culisetae TaxID=1213189 RepID=A0A1R1PFY9_ZANCU|nr:hypothetical protein AX774_g6804 [Zancudomyces culisetae]|eukprot:OMH79772.1 hypothetical protein AX774_g6804 [Zancudomyces culisetae]